ncbi:Sortilin-related receptor, partial [Orchesella cincta]
MERINPSGRHFSGILCLLVLYIVLSSCQGSLVRQISPSRQPYQIVQNWDTDTVSSVAASSDFPSHVLRKRDTTTTAATSSDPSSKIKRSAVPLNDSHNQLLVFWAGEDVILCLAKDVTSNASSTLWISRDYGGSFLNATSLLVQSGGSVVQPLPVLEGFFNHPSHNGHFAFTDVQNKYIFTTKNYGAEFTANKLEFVPDEVMFDPHSDLNIVAYEKSTKDKQMWVSIDYGKSWTKVQEHVKSLSWGDESVMPANLYLQREEPSPGPGERSIILRSNSLFLDAKDTEVIITGVEEFEIKDDFMFATKQKENGTYDLLISYRQSEFKKAVFPLSQLTKHFFIADVSTDGQIFVCVVQNESISNLFIGNFPTNAEENPTFSLSLERILFFKPNVTWSESWLNEVASETFVDLHHVEGLRGVYIASQLKPSTVSSGKFNMNEVISLITYDQGGEWQVLSPPEFEHDGRPIYCQY